VKGSAAPEEEDVLELEEQLHDHDKMVSMGVIEHEMEVMKVMISKAKGSERDYFKEKLSSL